MKDLVEASEPKSNEDWVACFYKDADLVDIDKLCAWFAEDIDLRFANNPPITDKTTATSVMKEFYNSITAMKHERLEIIGEGNIYSQQATVTYSSIDGRDVPLPVSSYLRRNANGLLDRLWIYIDIAPLYTLPTAI